MRRGLARAAGACAVLALLAGAGGWYGGRYGGWNWYGPYGGWYRFPSYGGWYRFPAGPLPPQQSQ